ncbi:hypothetical protein GNI_096560 [Gregarina niphandrodes]|uniref:WD domain, G-beta repeat protein n=1 Tax=Gregarina niphandrodes TaxID=110365 RepID=A0A023B4V5_GRENI|nr:hypothetical protein GNI_096560 [Gregarina niphandrodes]EZG57851.1 hypothetical protein GNI_096560 [Gregarina niphandrodes]|eukprot:XP_011131017.1 hypothetical protein GNI_096560 [Gregarina niphandrodes]
MGRFQLALGTYDGGILTYKIDDESLELEEYYGGVVHKGALRYLSWVDEATLVTGASDESCCVCDCVSEEVETLIVGARGCAGAFSQQWSSESVGMKSGARRKGGMVTTVACDGTVEVHQYTVRKPVFTTSFGQRNDKGKPLTHSSDICRVALNTHFGGLYACVYLDGSVWLWNIEKKLPLAKIHKASRKPEHGLLRAIDAAWASKGNYLLILSKGIFKVIQIHTGLTKTITAKSGRQFTSLSIHEELICVGDNKGTISLYKLLPPQRAKSDKHDDSNDETNNGQKPEDQEPGEQGSDNEEEGSEHIHDREPEVQESEVQESKEEEEPEVQESEQQEEPVGKEPVGKEPVGEEPIGKESKEEEPVGKEHPRKKRRRNSSSSSGDSSSPRGSGKEETSDDLFSVEEWVEIDIPEQSRIKLMKAFDPGEGLLANIIFCLQQGQVSILKVKENESVSFSQILDCPYTLTALDVISVTTPLTTPPLH